MSPGNPFTLGWKDQYESQKHWRRRSLHSCDCWLFVEYNNDIDDAEQFYTSQSYHIASTQRQHWYPRLWHGLGHSTQRVELGTASVGWAGLRWVVKILTNVHHSLTCLLPHRSHLRLVRLQLGRRRISHQTPAEKYFDLAAVDFATLWLSCQKTA